MTEDAQMPAQAHVPVMLEQVLAALAPCDGELIVDGTFGAGGYSRALLEACACKVVAIDRDPQALRLGEDMVVAYAGRLIFIEGRFAQMEKLMQQNRISQVDGVVLDIGVSSMQLDQAERGFSFMRDGPLDMRMDQGRDGESPTAAEVINNEPESRIAAILSVLGEERASRRIARAVVGARKSAAIETTGQLAAVVEKAVGRRPGQKLHPATRTFQALRLFVNRELEELAAALVAAERLLRPGGRLAVVSFHSLEDRIVKAFLAGRSGRRPRPSRHLPDLPGEGPEPSFAVPSGGVSKPSVEEIAANPRARSARLRIAQRTSAAPVPGGPEGLPVPRFQ